MTAVVIDEGKDSCPLPVDVGRRALRTRAHHGPYTTPFARLFNLSFGYSPKSFVPRPAVLTVVWAVLSCRRD
jgi:hypothetical protein